MSKYKKLFFMILFGLKNPGKEYEKTRHNAGAIVLEFLQKENLLDEYNVFFPDTFMNLSGEYVRKILKNKNFRKYDRLEKFAVFFDDVTIPVGHYKISVGEGASSHNGIRSIVENIKSLGLTKDDFVRVRIGVGKVIKGDDGKDRLYEPGPDKLSDFVLSNFNSLELAQIYGVARSVRERLSLI